MKEFEIRFSGSGGQGLILVTRILATALVEKGMKIAQSQSYEPTSRGGLSRSDLVASMETVDYPLASSLDYLLILDEVAVEVSGEVIGEGCLVLADSDRVSSKPEGKYSLYTLPLVSTADKLGSRRVANLVALGALAGLGSFCDQDALEMATRFHAPKGFLDLNLDALRAGYELSIEAPRIA
ncbi:MAG: 2-oxoacid:acceptor oxidoreductase family protein [SAR324 cluster bacterium]|nr:2-oxoacid:acceptor oxidoreductase family protein [SAR324 cluster bacterium]